MVRRNQRLVPVVVIIIVYLFFSLDSTHISFTPPDEAFLLYHGQQNFSTMFVQDGCPSSRHLKATVHAADRSESVKVFEEMARRCAARVHIVTERVYIDRPYVDVLAVLDDEMAAGRVCVHVQITGPTSSNAHGKCQLEGSSCVIRVPVPFAWFPTNRTAVLSASYTISARCDQRFHDLPQHLIELMSLEDTRRARRRHVLANTNSTHVALHTIANQSFAPNSLQSMFVSMQSSTNPLEIRLWVDARVSIETVYPMSASWRVRVSSSSRPLFYTSLVCENMANSSAETMVIGLLIKMTSSSVIKDDVILHWHVIHNDEGTDEAKVAVRFGVVADEIASIALVPRRKELINMAAISGQQVTSPMRVFTVSIGAKGEDVTQASHCISADAKLLKTSPTCSSVYVDGSELRGTSKVHIYAHYQRFTTSLSFRVWFPRLPLTVTTSTSTLHPIRNWQVGAWRELTHAAKQFICAPRYQKATARVFASMWIEDEATGDQLYLSSHKNILFDVTNIVHNTLQVSNRSVASIQFIKDEAIVQGERVGETEISVRNRVELGSTALRVSGDAVDVSGLSARAICRLKLKIIPIIFSPSFFKIDVHTSGRVERIYEHCSIEPSVSYNDGSWETMDAVDADHFDIVNNDGRVAVSHQNLIGIDNTHDRASVELILHTSAQCARQSPLAATLISLPISVVNRTTTANPMEEQRSSVSVPFFLLTISLLLVCFCLVSFVRRSIAFRGYELVAPLLSRLSSSAVRHEDTNEWVWLSQPSSSTIGSDYSSKSSYKRNDPRTSSISYHGSEISVFIAPNANVMVNNSSRQTMVDSSSDHNLTRVLPRNDSKSEYHTWTWKRDRIIRESVA